MAKARKPFARLLRVSTTRIDGGSLFGSTVKERWERFVTPDRQNRVAIGNYTLLLNHPEGLILVNVGPGDKAPLNLDIAPMRSRSSLLRELREVNVLPKDVAMVVLTHLHDEYAGGGTHMTSSGRVLPTFSNATYVVQKDALADAAAPSERSKHFYRRDDFEPLEEFEQLMVVDGTKEVAKGVWVEPAPGPTPGHQMVVAEAPDVTYAFLGALIPTAMHICPEVVTASDWDPDATARAKIDIKRHAIAESWRVAPVGTDEWLCAHELDSLAAFSRGVTLGTVPATAKAKAKEREHLAVAV